MGFIDEVREEVPQYHRNRCGVARWLATQTEITNADIREAAAKVSAAAATRALQKRGYPFKRSSVERHISGECSCPIS